MATQKETVEFLLAKLRQPKTFSARAMFGEYALDADGKVVALVCDDLRYVKIVPASAELETLCEKGQPYPGALGICQPSIVMTLYSTSNCNVWMNQRVSSPRVRP